jgi:hypothetical protein
MESLGDDYIQTPMEVETDSTGKHVRTLTMPFSKRSLRLCLHCIADIACVATQKPYHIELMFTYEMM